MNTQLPNITSEFAEWYNEVVYQAELADHAPVRGCMVVRPYGWAIWEQVQSGLDARFKSVGVVNAAFPMLIPESFLKKEAQHVEGFSPELAVVTHAGGKELEEPYVVRPTSETIIHWCFARWIRSWRDLPMKVNQWCSVVRWEMRTRPFLRTTEFFWQEGHTAHVTEVEAQDTARQMLKIYSDFIEQHLAIPVTTGEKSETERFAGATATYTMEGTMPDGKALQMGTSHCISQTFAHAFDIKFQDRDGGMSYPHLTSWGVTTRLIGAMVMTHGDQKGLIIPPAVAPIQVVIVPIVKKGMDTAALDNFVQKIVSSLGNNIRVHVDTIDNETPGAKFYRWELKGVPLRLDIGAQELAAGTVRAVMRHSGEKLQLAVDALEHEVPLLLQNIQKELLERARERAQNWRRSGAKLAEFGPLMEAHNGVYTTGWCQERECEQQLKVFKATTRCLVPSHTFVECFACSKPSKQDVLVAKAY
jgi:prolyl-tRNA synthetase